MEDAAVERLVGELAETRRHFDTVADGLRSGVKSDLEGLWSDIRSEMQELRAETREEISGVRRHFDVVAESLRSDIRLVAEGVATVDGKLQHFQAEVKEEFTEVRSMIKLSYTELDRRLHTLETSVHSLEERVERLEKTA
jgi:chromosome segregation ATPase